MPKLNYSSLTFTRNPERNFDILTRVEAGETFTAAAGRYGLCCESGRQIVAKMRRIRAGRKRWGGPWPVPIEETPE
jgi:hypothetical protein